MAEMENSEKQENNGTTREYIKRQPITIEELRDHLEEQLELLREVADNKADGKLKARDLTGEGLEAARMVILLHDMHKIFTGRGFKHYALPSPLREADMLASAKSRDRILRRNDFSAIKKRIRYSLRTRMLVTEKEPEADQLFKEIKANSAGELHEKLLKAVKLSELNEARTNPFTSVKHHLLLAGALAENFLETGKIALQGLILCIAAKKPKNNFKIIGTCCEERKKGKHLYLWLDTRYCGGGNAHLTIAFNDTWNNVVGMNTRKVRAGRRARTVKSWTTALVMLQAGE
ncbi:MAG: hypothetical protein ACXADA_19710 [Candidatus Hodarchaeales archaeon]|jgi:hypothetical protein